MSERKQLNNFRDLTALLAGMVQVGTVGTTDGAPTVGDTESSRLSADMPLPAPAQQPAVPIRSSVTDDWIICLEDGVRKKMLKRHLRAVYGLTPDAYRAKWGLPPSYPLVAPSYAKSKSDYAHKVGFGTNRMGATRETSPPLC